MKKIIVFILFLTSVFSLAQGNVQKTENTALPFIEVIGTASKEVVPDKIYIKILLTDKVVNNEKYTIESQEEKLKKALTSAGIDLKYLYLSDSSSEITKDKKKETGFKVIKEFSLIVKNSNEVSKVFKELYEINIKEAEISKAESSDIENIRKEVRIAAIKVAKEKAEYLLLAIGEKIDKPLEIKELDNSYLSRKMLTTSNSVIKSSDSDGDNMDFEKIIVTYSYYIKYSIKYWSMLPQPVLNGG